MARLRVVRHRRAQHEVRLSGAWHEDQQKNFPNSTYTAYQLQNGVASCASPTNGGTSCPGVLIAESLSPYQVLQDVRYDAFYAQEQYTTGRFTFQGAVRFDHSWSYFPDETVGPVRFLTTPVTFAQNDPALATPSTLLCSSDLKGANLPAGFSKTCINNVTGYKDITPRGAWHGTYGDGKTSVKFSLGKYLEAASSGNGNYTAGNPVSRMPTNRRWHPGIPVVERHQQELRAGLRAREPARQRRMRKP